MILFINNELPSVQGAKWVLQCFQLLTGLKINFQKSSFYGFGEESVSLDQWASFLGCSVGRGNLKYLGVKIGKSPKSISYWTPLISRVENKLQNWKADHISMAGTLTLLKAALDSIPVYWFSLFLIPAAIIH